MGKLVRIGKVLECFNIYPLGTGSCSCLCMNSAMEDDLEYDEFDTKPLIPTNQIKPGHLLRLKDVVSGNQTLASQLKPKMVMLRVSMHCNGCARKVEKHISKIEGVSSYKVDLESKMVVVTGDILPFEVLESVSKVKNAQFWDSSSSTSS